MKVTQPKKVIDIVRPPFVGMALDPKVNWSEPITRAVELMLKHNLRMIAVIEGNRAIGYIQLAEALNCLGLHLSKQSGLDRPDAKG